MPLFRASSGPADTAAWEVRPHSIRACQRVRILPGQRGVEVGGGGHRTGVWGLCEEGGESLVAGGSVCVSICANLQA